MTSRDSAHRADQPEQGVLFAASERGRSSTRVGKAVFADAVRSVDGSLASRIESTSDWRKGYPAAIREVVAAGIPQGKDALRIASDGLDSIRRNLRFAKDGLETSLDDALSSAAEGKHQTVTVEGEGSHPGRLEVPYRGRTLADDALLQQLDDWATRGILEPSTSEAIAAVVRNPDWLRLGDMRFALIGAASEMGPLEPLNAWGAQILAVDLPRRHLWDHVAERARRGNGRLSAPVIDGSAPASATDGTPGADLLTHFPEVRSWLDGFDGPVTVGNYIYADGSTFVRLAGAVDALIGDLCVRRTDISIAYLATPTDVFAVPGEVVDAARARAKASKAGRVAGGLTRSTFYRPNYGEEFQGEDGRRWGISDSLVPIQGPSYALAKAMQRWRAILAREEGAVTSANIAPASHTRSVVKNRLLAAAYRGAPSFGVEIFDSDTTRWLMAALLVHDLRNPTAAARPETQLDHPYDLFCEAALHGGIWRLGFEARSILPLGLALGLVKRR